ncbi:MAG: ribosome-binding factor A [bacterium]|nr:ribosome-binding factor A [bacterium]
METRIAKINELIRAELAMTLKRTVEFRLGTLVTITTVECDSELKNATVHLTVFPQDYEKEALLLIKKLSGPLQHALNHKLSMRFVPQLSYYIDKEQTAGYAVEELLNSIKED